MADGIWAGLTRTLLRDSSIKLIRRCKNGTGLARPDIYDWPTNLRTLLETEKADIAIVSLGLNDRQDLFVNGRRQHFFRTEAWKTTYLERIQTLLDPLTEKRIPTVWVGLPIMRDTLVSQDSEFLNRLYEPAVAAAGATFFPLWTLSADETQAYKTHVKGSDGRLRSFRNEDGMHLTPIGYDLVAQALLQTLRPWLKEPQAP